MAVTAHHIQAPITSRAASESTSQATTPTVGFTIPSLDGIRAASVLWVFLAHAGLSEWGVPGNLGVTVFFFLSGYLITTLLRMEFERHGGISLRAFYLRRTLRIFPPMYLTLAIASALCYFGVLEGSLRLDAVLAQVFHLTNYNIVSDGWWEGRAPGTWVYWSLAVEEHFYLVFPAFYLALLRFVPARHRQLLILIGVCAAVLAWRLALVHWFDASKDRTYVASDTRIDSILFGCMLAIYGNPALDQSRVSSTWWKALWLPLGIVGLVLSIVIRNPQFQETFRYTIQGLALFPLFVVAIKYPEWRPCKALNLAWIRFIGVLSYTLYLVHTTVLFGVHAWTPWHPFIQGAVALGLCLVFATAMYYGVEKPCASLRKRLSRIGGQRQGGAPVRSSPVPTPMPAPSTMPLSSTAAGRLGSSRQVGSGMGGSMVGPVRAEG
jgi:peptidoglycan/LPS O-acetylase OafA/YrhL